MSSEAAYFPSKADVDPRHPVLIVDDSTVARSVIGRMIDATARFTLAGAVGDVASALAWLHHHHCDIILLDIEMPGTDGLTALPDLIAASHGARILVVSSACDDGAASTVQALALGAADTLVKPGIGSFAGQFAKILEHRLMRLVDAGPDPVTLHVPMPPSRARVPQEFDVVAIGASTGGIHALGQLLRAIPASFEVPILITQHLPPTFMSYFATQTALLAGRPCDVAEDRMRIRPGRVVVAPGDGHMRCVRMSDGAAIRITHERVSSGCMPSVDPMFASLADVFGARVLGVVLSGMGRDGSEGAQRLIRAGGSVVVQDKESSVVWGMPGAVASTGNASAILPPAEIGQLIASRQRPKQ